MEDQFTLHPEVRKKLERIIEKKGLVDFVLNTELGSAKGDNFFGVITRATAKGTGKNGRNVILNLIVKSAPQFDSYRKFINLKGVYGREIYMYEQVFPQFRKYESVKKVLDPFTSTAPLYMTCLEDFQECLVLEDMKALGYQMKDRQRPLDLEHVQLVMRAYGKFHAISYALKDQKPDVMGTLADATEENIFNNFDEGFMKSHAKNICDKAMKSLKTVEDEHVVNLFAKFAEKPMELILEAFDMALADPYSVVVHGDCWVTNMLFNYGDKRRPDRPTEVCLLDFQLSKYGSPAFDLSYFIFTCTDKALRDKYYDQIIGTYYETLCSHVANLGSDAQKLLPFTALEAQLRRYSVYGLYMSATVLHLMMSETDEIPDLTKSSTEEELMDPLMYETRNVEIYNDRVCGMILDFVGKGYLDFLE